MLQYTHSKVTETDTFDQSRNHTGETMLQYTHSKVTEPIHLIKAVTTSEKQCYSTRILKLLNRYI